MIKKNYYFYALSLIEIVIAIFIFSFGVLGILQVMIKNIETLDYVDYHQKAYFLAKEGLDIVINKRDSNLLQGLPWDCVFFDEDDILEADPCFVYFLSGSDSSFFVVGLSTGSSYVFEPFDISEQDNNKSNLYHCSFFDGHTMLTHFCDGTGSLFKRYIEIKPVVRSGIANYDNNFIHVLSHVFYQQGIKTGHIILQTFLSTSQRIGERQ